MAKIKRETARLIDHVDRMARNELEHVETRGSWHEHHERNHKTLRKVHAELGSLAEQVAELTAERNTLSHNLTEARREQFNTDKQKDEAEKKLEDTKEELVICKANMLTDQVKAARKHLDDKRAERAKLAADKADREAKKAAKLAAECTP